MESQIAPPLVLDDLSLGNFTAKKILGMGSSGKAELVECHSNGRQYAMKTIQGVFDEEHGVQASTPTGLFLTHTQHCLQWTLSSCDVCFEFRCH